VRPAPLAQAYYHWRFHEMDCVRETSMELADYVAQYGTAYTRQGWDYRVRKMCRVVNVPSLFPQGVDAAVQAQNMQAQQMQMQFQQAVQAGQANPADASKLPQMTNALELVQQTIENEYVMSADNPLEHTQVIEITKTILGGSNQVRLYYNIITSDRPAWKALNPLDVIVPRT
jgi:phage tail sheath protein FI